MIQSTVYAGISQDNWTTYSLELIRHPQWNSTPTVGRGKWFESKYHGDIYSRKKLWTETIGINVFSNQVPVGLDLEPHQ